MTGWYGPCHVLGGVLVSSRKEREEKKWHELELVAEDEAHLINAILNADIAINTLHLVSEIIAKIARTQIHHRLPEPLLDVKRLLDEAIHNAAKIEEHINKAIDSVAKKKKG